MASARRANMRTSPLVIAALVSSLVGTSPAVAQHVHGDPAGTPDADDDAVHGEARTAPNQGPATSRDGSGTAWLPESSPVHAIHLTTGDVRWMFHGNLHA